VSKNDTGLSLLKPKPYRERLLDAPTPWATATGIVYGVHVFSYLRERTTGADRMLRSLVRHVDDHTSSTTNPYLRLAIGADLLFDGLNAEESVITLGQVKGDPLLWLQGEFFFTAVESPAVVAVKSGDHRLSLALVPKSDGTVVSVSADTAAASVVLALRAVQQPDDAADAVRAFRAAGCEISKEKIVPVGG
jgi:hypothetical protein